MQAEEYTYKTWAKRDSKPSSGFYVAITRHFELESKQTKCPPVFYLFILLSKLLSKGTEQASQTLIC